MSTEKFLELLGERIRRLRGESEVSLSQFARNIGISGCHLSQIERGESNPRITTLIAIADELGESLEDLIPNGRA